MELLFLMASFVIIVAASFIFVFLILHKIRAARFPALPIKREELPSLSVCIPARNETLALADCLQSVLASDYPKLEVLVLDDCSQDNTAEIIKSFAHDGVRFVEGLPPPDGWLGRPFACESLRQTANSSWLLYLDVDTRVSPSSISRLVGRAIADNSAYVSVLPKRSGEYLGSILLAPLRYFYTLLSDHSASGSVQLFRSDDLKAAGGFELVKDAPEMESFFAHFWAPDKTRFWISSGELGLTYDKKLQSQREHTIRASFPALGEHVTASLAYALILLACGVIPIAGAVWSLVNHDFLLFIVAASIYVGTQVLPYFLFARAAYRRGALFSALLMPLLLVQEAVLVIISMVDYSIGRVPWKDRNVCFPSRYRS